MIVCYTIVILVILLISVDINKQSKCLKEQEKHEIEKDLQDKKQHQIKKTKKITM